MKNVHTFISQGQKCAFEKQETILYTTSSPADKKYGSTLPTNYKSETSDTNIWPKQQ